MEGGKVRGQKRKDPILEGKSTDCQRPREVELVGAVGVAGNWSVGCAGRGRGAGQRVKQSGVPAWSISGVTCLKGDLRRVSFRRLFW